MTPTRSPKYVPGYDLFKLIVALILTIILISLIARNRQVREIILVVTATNSPATDTVVPSLSPTEAVLPDTLTPVFTFTPTSTQIPPATETLTLLPTPTQTLIPTQAVQIVTPGPNNCPSAASRIKVGEVVSVLRRLNLRTGPGLVWPIILTNNPKTELEVIGGPVCTPQTTLDGSTKAHLWWLVRMTNGQVGWSAEGQLLATNYLLEPIH